LGNIISPQLNISDEGYIKKLISKDIFLNNDYPNPTIQLTSFDTDNNLSLISDRLKLNYGIQDPYNNKFFMKRNQINQNFTVENTNFLATSNIWPTFNQNTSGGSVWSFNIKNPLTNSYDFTFNTSQQKFFIANTNFTTTTNVWPTFNQNTSGNAATADYSTTAGSATNATTADFATAATNAEISELARYLQPNEFGVIQDLNGNAIDYISETGHRFSPKIESLNSIATNNYYWTKDNDATQYRRIYTPYGLFKNNLYNFFKQEKACSVMDKKPYCPGCNCCLCVNHNLVNPGSVGPCCKYCSYCA